MDKIGAREACLKFAEVLNRAAFAKNRIVFTKNGKEVAALFRPSKISALWRILKTARIVLLQGAFLQVIPGLES